MNEMKWNNCHIHLSIKSLPEHGPMCGYTSVISDLDTAQSDCREF